MKIVTATQAFNNDPHCGDQTAWWSTPQRTMLCIADGLGHGQEAEAASLAATSYVACHLEDSLEDIVSGCDLAIRHTRGVALGLAAIDDSENVLTYVGIGNTRAIVYGAKNSTLLNTFGIVGGGYQSISKQSLKISHGDLVILCTDGIHELLELSISSETENLDPQALAQSIINQCSLLTDDSAVLVMKHEVFS